MSAATELVALLAGHRYAFTFEHQLQAQIRRVCDARAGDWQVEREVRLGSQAERIDLLVTAGVERVGIEVKVAGSAASVYRQLMRYSKTDKLDTLILVTNRASHQRGELRDWMIRGVPRAVPLHIVRTRWI